MHGVGGHGSSPETAVVTVGSLYDGPRRTHHRRARGERARVDQGVRDTASCAFAYWRGLRRRQPAAVDDPECRIVESFPALVNDPRACDTVRKPFSDAFGLGGRSPVW